MVNRRRAALLIVTVLVATSGCTGPADPPVEVDRTGPPLRTSWALTHTVGESKNLRVIGTQISHYEESTQVAGGRDASGSDPGCGVTVSAVGQGGPDNVVGEQIATQVRGRPAIRNGAGAEYAYLMWVLDDGRWVTVSCNDSDDRASVDAVAPRVQIRPASIALPFDLDRLPDGYLVDFIAQDPDRGTTVSVGHLQPEFGLPDSELEISYGGYTSRLQPTGRTITVNGRPARLSDNPRFPGVCVFVPTGQVCVWSSSSDTGPYPDRSGEIPAIVAIAESMRFAADLDDRSTWFTADRVFG